MSQCTFSDDDLQAIRQNRFSHPCPVVQFRCHVLFLEHQNRDHEEIADFLDCSRSTVQRILRLYREGGLKKIEEVTIYRRRGELQKHAVSLKEYFTQHPPRSVKQARQVIEELTGIRRSLTQVRLFLKQLGFSPRKVAAVPVPPKSTLADHVENQQKFLDGELEPRLEEARDEKRQLFFVDASHFVFSTFLGILWCVARVFLPGAHGRKRFNVLGALNAATHELITVTNEAYINAETVCELLHKIAAQAKAGVPITLVMDNARYQRCQRVRDCAAELGIELLFLPSYSPNLNLIERVWRFVKKECLNSTYHSNYTSMRESIERCLSELDTTHREAMKTLLTHKFQTFENVSILAA